MNDYLKYLENTLKDNSDLKKREIKCNQGTIYLLFIDNLCDSKFISQYIIAPVIKKKDIPPNIDLVKTEVLYGNSLGDIYSKDEAIIHLLSGDVVILFDFMYNVIFCEAKGYSKRSISTPITEAVIKGPREGFNETLVDGISLIRRRIKNPNLKVETSYIGDVSNTAIAMIYLKDSAPQELVNYIKSKLDKIKLNFIIDTNYIEEELKCKSTFFDTIGYTEKPDLASSNILQGRVVILVDGTPFALIAPYFFIENFQMADDYYLNRHYTNIARIVRIVAFCLAVFLPGLYIAFTTYHFPLIPLVFVFRLAASRADVPLPTILEVFLMIFFFQLLREAGIRLPQPIGQAMSIVGALILGQSAVSAGLASQSTVIVVALSAISSFLTPKLYGAIITWGIIVLLLSSLMGMLGFFMGIYMFVSHIASLDSCGYPYALPMVTKKNLRYKDLFFREELPHVSNNNLNKDEDK